jgi:hypothetical protein
VFPEPWYTIGDLEIGLEVLSDAIRHIYHFECDEHRVVADILMKVEDPS